VELILGRSLPNIFQGHCTLFEKAHFYNKNEEAQKKKWEVFSFLHANDTIWGSLPE
jgi:hypothetical protein